MKACIIGTGYVGSVTGAILAEHGHEVVCTDNNPLKIKAWNDGPPFPLLEPGLEDIVLNHRGQNLHFSADLSRSLNGSDLAFVCVNTPTKTEGVRAGSFDMQYVENVARTIAENGKKGIIVVEKSTVPLRTAERIREIMQANGRQDISVVSNPEFLAEGCAIQDARDPDRILIGTMPEDSRARDIMNTLYTKYPHERIIHTGIWSSELAKIANNAFLSTKITQINGIGELCEQSGANVLEVAKAVGMDKRISNRFLGAGIGWGGSCFGKDLRALIYLLKHYHCDDVAGFYQAAHDLNYSLRKRFVERMHHNMYSLPNKKVVALGFSFKPDTDDTRDAPAIDIIGMLAEEGADVLVIDPASSHKVQDTYKGRPYAGRITVSFEIDEAVRNADAVMLLTEWKEFRELDLKRMAQQMRKPAWLFDGRHVYTPETANTAGLNYYAPGRGTSKL